MTYGKQGHSKSTENFLSPDPENNLKIVRVWFLRTIQNKFPNISPDILQEVVLSAQINVFLEGFYSSLRIFVCTNPSTYRGTLSPFVEMARHGGHVDQETSST